MKIVNLLFTCVAWFKYTSSIQHSPPHANPLPNFEEAIMERFGMHSSDVIHHGDFMTIQRVVNHTVVPHDIVGGYLHRLPFGVVPELENHRYGAALAIVTPGIHFVAEMGRSNNYEDTGNNEGNVTYACKIARGVNIFLEATLIQPGQSAVPLNPLMPRVAFVNRHGLLVNGELYRR